MVVAIDALIVPMAVICRFVSEIMLQGEGVCVWTLAGIECFTCGGTHFVNDLLSFRIVDAMVDNPLLFAITVYLLITLIALNLFLLANLKFAGRVLRLMYNLPVAAAWVVAACLFFFIRNFEAFMNIDEVAPRVWRVTLWMLGFGY